MTDIIDADGNPIENPDLNNGFITETIRVKEGATPIDNKTKWAWDDDDYETVQVYRPYTEEEFALVTKPTVDDVTDALADISDTVSTNADDLSTISDAIAELSELVANLASESEVSNG